MPQRLPRTPIPHEIAVSLSLLFSLSFLFSAVRHGDSLPAASTKAS